MEGDEIEILQRHLSQSFLLHLVLGSTVDLILRERSQTTTLLHSEVVVGFLECAGVAGLRERTVDFWVLRREMRLVEVVDVGHVRSVYRCRRRKSESASSVEQL